MKLATFASVSGGAPQLGVLDSSSTRILNLSAAGVAGDMVDLIGTGEAGLAKVEAIRSVAPEASWIPLSEIALRPPIAMRRNVFCVGKNYRSHAREFHQSGFDASSKADGDAIPVLPVVFTKASSSVIGAHDSIPAYLDETGTVDYEGELGVVIGRGGRGITRESAMNHIFGFTIINDVTSRKLQRDHAQWFIGKSLDGFCPMGPWVVTRDEMGDLDAAGLRTFVDGELRQQALFSDLIFDVATVVAAIGQRTTLQPGDVIATGTPEGVGIGFKPPRFLRKGQVVTIEIDRIGALRNPVA